MPDVGAGDVEPGADAGDLTGVGDDRVFKTGLPWRRSVHGAGHPGRGIEHLAPHDLKLHQMQVDGVSI